MSGTLSGVDLGRIERFCAPRPGPIAPRPGPVGPGPDSIRFGPGVQGIERAEVRLSAAAFEPHRHDSYAIGITTAGVQIFHYRGARRVCLSGQLHILHPDETHDGAAGTDEGFGYRILYVAPEIVRAAVPRAAALPFVADPVQPVRRATRRLRALLADIDDPIGELRGTEIAAVVADALLAMGGRAEPALGTIDIKAVERVREYLAAHPREHIAAVALEQIAGLDRFTICRQFRRAFGTSPDRYRTLRRLEVARAAIEHGESLVTAATEAGFADQSHMSRQFKRAYGLTPGRWAALTGAVPESGAAGMGST